MYFYLTRFDYDRNIPHGGTLRVLQIMEQYNGLDEIEIGKIQPIKFNLKNMKYFIKVLKLYLVLLFSLKISVNKYKELLKITFVCYVNLKHIIDVFGKNVKVITDLTNKYYPINAIMNRMGIYSIYVLHNLESLVPGSNYYYLRNKPWLSFELDYLRYSDVIITISREENWLLFLKGIPNEYLPYYPPKVKLDYLNNVKNLRLNNITGFSNNILILGTYCNNPTKIGMDNLMNALLGVKDYNYLNFLVAGLDTELMNYEFNTLPRNIKILGTVDDGRLADLLIFSKAVIIDQPYSSGALTKMVELNIINIPVFANTASVRSNYHLNNITEYKDKYELFEMLGLGT